MGRGCEAARSRRTIPRRHRTAPIDMYSDFARLVPIAFLYLLCGRAAQATDDLIWFDDNRLTGQAHELLKILRSDEYGLKPSDYEPRVPLDVQHTAMSGLVDGDARHRFDAAFTDAVARFAAHVHRGRVGPRAGMVAFEWAGRPSWRTTCCATPRMTGHRKQSRRRSAAGKPFVSD